MILLDASTKSRKVHCELWIVWWKYCAITETNISNQGRQALVLKVKSLLARFH